MFGRIARGYDRLNSLLSMGLHHRWRRIAVDACRLPADAHVLDVAVGTGDFAIEAARRGASAVGVDPCVPMLEVAAEKLRDLGLTERIRLVVGEAERLPVAEGRFDAATIGFALRNVTDIGATFAEMTRAVRPGGRVVALEISRPRGMVLRPLFALYFYHLSPWMARLLGGDAEAYAYLPRSVQRFNTREELAAAMKKAGLTEAAFRDLSGGMVCVYTGTRPPARPEPEAAAPPRSAHATQA